MIEYHSPANPGGRQANLVLPDAVLHDTANGIAFELQGDPACQAQAAATGQHAAVENPAKILRRERRRHSMVSEVKGRGKIGGASAGRHGVSTVACCARSGHSRDNEVVSQLEF